jgi:S1-C subfamily serine protease
MTRGPVRVSRIGLAALLLSGATACAADDGDSVSADELRRSAVGVVAGGCSLTGSVGSGVVVEADGQVVTVAHTIRGASDVSVVDADGVEHPATIVAFDKDSDLAVLDAPTLEAAPLPVGDVGLGDADVLVWRRDEGSGAKAVEVVKRLRITIEDIYVDEIVERTGLELTGPIVIGDSGGGVVTAGGELIGIVYASSRERDDVGFATDSAEIRSVLASRSGAVVANGRCP